MTGELNKDAIIAALRHGYEKGVLVPGGKRPATFDAKGAWTALQGAMGDIKRLQQVAAVARTGKRGRPTGRPAEDPVALLAPIYKRYTGARATVSHPNAKRVAALIAYHGKEVKPRRSNPNRGFGPFAKFVIAVVNACGLPKLGADTIDKTIDILRSGNEDKSKRSEAQARFKSTHRIATEVFAGFLATRGTLPRRVKRAKSS